MALMILIAGPYRSGTGDDPARLAANVAAMEAYLVKLRGLACTHGYSRVPGAGGDIRSLAGPRGLRQNDFRYSTRSASC